jgi:uncharacterized protein involved in exopolysaccharide biosynthesis
MGNEWQKRFGAARRLTDRKLLAECERQIALEEKQFAETVNATVKAAQESLDNLDARRAIARAFGRPIH